MKDRIYDMLHSLLEADCNHGEGVINDSSLTVTSKSMTQFMCDLAIHQMWYFGRWPVGFILITNMQKGYLMEQGFTEEQIQKSLANADNFK